MKPKRPMYDPTAALVAAKRRVMAFKRAAVIVDNGYRRCLFCGAQTHMGQRVAHKATCPMHPSKEKS